MPIAGPARRGGLYLWPCQQALMAAPDTSLRGQAPRLRRDGFGPYPALFLPLLQQAGQDT